MVEFTEMAGITFRSRLLTFQRATAWAKALEANPRFTEVSVVPSARAKSSTVRYYVTYMPSSLSRQQAILDRERLSRVKRAESETFAFTWDADLGAFRCHSGTSGKEYEVTVSSCTCGDWLGRGRANSLPCKHQCSLLSQLEDGAVCEDAPAPVEDRRTTEQALFDTIFGDSYTDWLR
jgi:hypothetical protein